MSKVFVGAEGKVDLHDQSYAWTPKSWSFEKLHEVGVSPYLGFILSLSTLRMFESIEVVKDHLIGPKPWNRINIKF